MTIAEGLEARGEDRGMVKYHCKIETNSLSKGYSIETCFRRFLIAIYASLSRNTFPKVGRALARQCQCQYQSKQLKVTLKNKAEHDSLYASFTHHH